MHEYHAAELADGSRKQAQARLVEIRKQRVFARHRLQLPRQLVEPLVVRTLKAFRRTAAVLQELRAPVAADVVEGLERTCVIPDYNQRVAAHLNTLKVAGLRQIVRHTGKRPVAAEELVLLALEVFRGRVAVRRNQLRRLLGFLVELHHRRLAIGSLQ